jgi:hypothetical protein
MVNLMHLQQNEGAIEIGHETTLLLRYVFQEDLPQQAAPRPYFHPLQTLGGITLTDYMPADHPWHLGLSIGVPSVSGVNFWGGNTYVPPQGYRLLPNHGQIQHRRWLDWSNTPTAISGSEELVWLNSAKAVWLNETRRLTARLLPTGWQLELHCELTNVSQQALSLRSPAVDGQRGAGYGGIFWRAAAHLTPCRFTAADTHFTDEALNGGPSSTITFHAAAVQATFRQSTGQFPWFIRQHKYVGVGVAWAAATEYRLLPAQTLISALQIDFYDKS